MGSFRKQRAAAPRGFFACEAAGLRWLAGAEAVRVVQVLAVDDHGLDLERIEPASATVDAARAFGRDLARLHDTGAPAFGSPPPGWEGDGFFGPLDDPYPLIAGAHHTWGAHYADDRVAQLRDLLGAVLPEQVRNDLERIREHLHSGTWDDDADAPARLHGDLWSGNLMWTPADDGGVEAVLVDPAAHGGHRLTDLAMLDLFGAPHLDAVFDAYEQAHPLRPGWRDLLGLHQIYPVGMHAVLFGGGYLGQLGRLAARYTGADRRRGPDDRAHAGAGVRRGWLRQPSPARTGVVGLARRPSQPPAPTDPDSYRRMGIEDRADWAQVSGPLSAEMLEAVLADDPYVIAEFARAPISAENLAEMHRRVTDPVVLEWIATNFNAPLELMAAVPLQRHTVHSAMAFLERLGIWETRREGLSDLLNEKDDDARPILEAVREELGIEVRLPAEGE